MKITIETIDHNQQRYPTIGDWYFQDGQLVIRVSNLSDRRHEFLVAFHELVEAILCIQDGVDEQEITDFDTMFELNRPQGNTDEPGDDISAPYKQQHLFATGIEKLLAERLEVTWKTYENDIIKTEQTYEPQSTQTDPIGTGDGEQVAHGNSAVWTKPPKADPQPPNYPKGRLKSLCWGLSQWFRANESLLKTHRPRTEES